MGRNRARRGQQPSGRVPPVSGSGVGTPSLDSRGSKVGGGGGMQQRHIQPRIGSLLYVTCGRAPREPERSPARWKASGCLIRRSGRTARYLRCHRTGRSSATRHAAELSLLSCAVVLPSQGPSATATGLSSIGRDVEVGQSDVLRAARAKPTWLPRRYARRVPDGDRRPLHGAVWQPNEVNSIRPVDGRDMMTTKDTHPRWGRRLRRVVCCEGAQRVIPDCPSHRVLTRQP